jgi:hypothetical protein
MKKKIAALKELAIRSHYYCDDYWYTYTCPKHEEGCCNDDEGDECNCGTDKHNAEVEKIYSEIEDIKDLHEVEAKLKDALGLLKMLIEEYEEKED